MGEETGAEEEAAGEEGVRRRPDRAHPYSAWMPAVTRTGLLWDRAGAAGVMAVEAAEGAEGEEEAAGPA